VTRWKTEITCWQGAVSQKPESSNVSVHFLKTCGRVELQCHSSA